MKKEAVNVTMFIYSLYFVHSYGIGKKNPNTQNNKNFVQSMKSQPKDVQDILSLINSTFFG